MRVIMCFVEWLRVCIVRLVKFIFIFFCFVIIVNCGISREMKIYKLIFFKCSERL